MKNPKFLHSEAPGARRPVPEQVKMEQYFPVICRAPKRGKLGLADGSGQLCGGARWTAQEMFVYGIDRLRREDRTLDVQFPAGIRMVCVQCGSVQSKEDIDATVNQ